ncbi:hypothetical protein CPAR01_15253 [Colletotrichum paranaense]|uniref:Uncharacterized protein n=1 Tax=Colletotrichum paranaense TaxID=1914294 RepID=A0ABQ9S0F5_9PEZI|nr:uncharacterized protein CPAR01_15253 [Colletotrichum paranaense]KAK1520202.1 hypothetical protein CPAR01_15253 [Colletotrichum paranaense]
MEATTAPSLEGTEPHCIFAVRSTARGFLWSEPKREYLPAVARPSQVYILGSTAQYLSSAFALLLAAPSPGWSVVPDSVFQAVKGTSTFFSLVIIVAFGLDSGRVGKGGDWTRRRRGCSLRFQSPHKKY